MSKRYKDGDRVIIRKTYNMDYIIMEFMLIKIWKRWVEWL